MTFVWAGVDVGASKGFDVAVVDRERLVGPPKRIVTVAGVVDHLSKLRPAVIAVDSPRTPAMQGRRSRAGERDLVKAGVCGIRYTPDENALRGQTESFGEIVVPLPATMGR